MRKKSIVLLSPILPSTSGGQNVGREVEMIRPSKVEEHRCPSRKCRRLVVIGIRRGKGGPRKN